MIARPLLSLAVRIVELAREQERTSPSIHAVAVLVAARVLQAAIETAMEAENPRSAA